MGSSSKFKIFAIADLHLAIAIPDKRMDHFGDATGHLNGLDLT